MIISKIILVLSILLIFGFSLPADAIVLGIGSRTTINISCSDVNGNLSQCNATSPCANTCAASGSSGSCSCQYTCSVAGTYSVCGQAVDAYGLSDTDCLDTVICNAAPAKPSTVAEEVWNNCSFEDASVPTLEWTYSDADPQTAFEVRIGPNASFPPSPGTDEYTASGGASTAYTPITTTWADYMEWNHNYWWIVRVKDSYTWSPWSNANMFATPVHAYPWPEFTWIPEDPNQDEVVIFDPVETGVNFLWTVTQGDGTFTDETNPTSEVPHVTFSTFENRIKLRVTDSVPYSCESDEQSIEASLPLPEYEEIPPVGWFNKTWQGLVDLFDGFILKIKTVG